MKSKKKQQNIILARTHFGSDLTKDVNVKYNVHRIDHELFELGMEYGLKDATGVVPKQYIDKLSFVEGFNRAKRILQSRIDSYNKGKEYYFMKIPFLEIPEIYRNNENFMSGYEDARNIELESLNVSNAKR